MAWARSGVRVCALRSCLEIRFEDSSQYSFTANLRVQDITRLKITPQSRSKTELKSVILEFPNSFLDKSFVFGATLRLPKERHSLVIGFRDDAIDYGLSEIVVLKPVFVYIPSQSRLRSIQSLSGCWGEDSDHTLE